MPGRHCKDYEPEPKQNFQWADWSLPIGSPEGRELMVSSRPSNSKMKNEKLKVGSSRCDDRTAQRAVPTRPENRAVLTTVKRPLPIPREQTGLRGNWKIATAILLAFCILNFAFVIPSPQAATIIGYPKDVHQVSLGTNTAIIFTPTNSVTFNQTNTYAGPPVVVYPTNGMFSTVLEAGHYWVLIRPRAAFHIVVPDSTNTYNIAHIAVEGALTTPSGTYLLVNP